LNFSTFQKLFPVAGANVPMYQNEFTVLFHAMLCLEGRFTVIYYFLKHGGRPGISFNARTAGTGDTNACLFPHVLPV
jgi:hypothetical protein